MIVEKRSFKKPLIAEVHIKCFNDNHKKTKVIKGVKSLEVLQDQKGKRTIVKTIDDKEYLLYRSSSKHIHLKLTDEIEFEEITLSGGEERTLIFDNVNLVGVVDITNGLIFKLQDKKESQQKTRDFKKIASLFDAEIITLRTLSPLFVSKFSEVVFTDKTNKKIYWKKALKSVEYESECAFLEKNKEETEEITKLIIKGFYANLNKALQSPNKKYKIKRG